MVAIDELVDHSHDVFAVVRVSLEDLRQYVYLSLRLQQEGLPRLDDLDRHFKLIHLIVGTDNLAKRAL